MSILSGTSTNGNNTKAPIFHEFKKQASFFFKEKIKTARLALTDVTPTQLLAEEAVNGDPGGPDARSLKMISKAAFEVDDYWRVVEILHTRLVRFDKSNWRASYKALIVLEYLLTHGPDSIAEEFQSDRDVIREMGNFQHVDEKGFNWGLNARKKSERVMKLLEKGTLYREERDKARKISRGIEGFGSFSHRTSSGQEIVQQFGRCNSQFNNHINQEDFFSLHDENGVIKTKRESTLPVSNNQEIQSLLLNSLNKQVDTKENLAPDEEVFVVKSLQEGIWNSTGESKPLLSASKDESRRTEMNMIDHHPFDDADEQLTALSLLSDTGELQQTR